MLERFAVYIITKRVWVVGALAVFTAALGWFAAQIDVKTEFTDLLPKNHPYVHVDNQFKTSFGGSNLVTIMVAANDGDIFRPELLEKVRRLQNELQRVKSVNPFQITSLASKKLKEVRASTDEIESRPLMWPEVPKDQEGIERVRLSAVNNPLIFGKYVSTDMKAALITVDFYDTLLDYETIFGQMNAVLERERDASVTISVVGEPMLYGWVRHFLPETLSIFLITMVVVAAILFVSSRSLRGTLIPLLAGLVSAVWALGLAQLLGFSFDPLVVVVAFLISARSVSHSVQVVSHFEMEAVEKGKSAVDAAVASIRDLFKPGTLGVVTDAGGIAVVALTPIPLLEKVAIIGCLWVLTISLTSVFLTPALLAWVRRPRSHLLPLDISRQMNAVLDGCTWLSAGRLARPVVAAAAAVLVGSGVYAFNLKIGDANPGSPILWPDSAYNRAAGAINRTFGGADRMFVVAAGERPDVIKEPAVLAHMQRLQRFLEAQPEIGATVSIADVVPTMNKILHEGNPRYAEIGPDARTNGELLYLYTAGSDPGDLDQFVDGQFANASVTAFFRDRKGDTIATAIGRIKTWLADNPIDGVVYKLAGSIVGVIAAVNEILLAGQIEAISLALLVVVLTCTVTYGTTTAGLFFMVPVLLSNAITFAFMAWKGIGMNINTVPVAALGIGLGVDYSFYIVDRIKEELPKTGELRLAIFHALRSSGRAVLVTGLTLCVSVLVWMGSSLKFQAEMGLLMGLWLLVSAVASLVVMPALVVVFKPRFVVGEGTRTEAAAQARLLTAAE